eukprot:57852-Amphidinium_carterae.1
MINVKHKDGRDRRTTRLDLRRIPDLHLRTGARCQLLITWNYQSTFLRQSKSSSWIGLESQCLALGLVFHCCARLAMQLICAVLCFNTSCTSIGMTSMPSVWKIASTGEHSRWTQSIMKDATQFLESLTLNPEVLKKEVITKQRKHETVRTFYGQTRHDAEFPNDLKIEHAWMRGTASTS